MQTISLPVAIGGVYSGLADVAGVVAARDDALVMEFQVRDAVVHIFKSPLRTIVVPYSDIAELSFRKAWGSSRLEIRTHSLGAFDQIPGSHGPVVKLHVEKRDRELAEELASIVMLRMSELRLRQVLNPPDPGIGPDGELGE